MTCNGLASIWSPAPTITPSTMAKTACSPTSSISMPPVWFTPAREKSRRSPRPRLSRHAQWARRPGCHTATFRPWNQAGEQRPDLRGRPGINPLGFTTTYGVDAAAFEQLKRISQGLGFEKSNERARNHFYSDKEIGDGKAAELNLLGNRYVPGEGFAIATEANQRDLQDNLRWIREARRQADWLVVSAHCHEFGGSSLLTASTRASWKRPPISSPGSPTRPSTKAPTFSSAMARTSHGCGNL